jgi:hypothetical protein
MNLELINLNQPSEMRHFGRGVSTSTAWGLRSSVGDLQAGLALVRARRADLGMASCQVGHVGLVLSGQAVARMPAEYVGAAAGSSPT